MNTETKPVPQTESPHLMPAEADPPVRSIYLHEEGLRELGARLAAADAVADAALDQFDFHERNQDNSDTILNVYSSTNEAQGAGETVTPAAQWLLDNHYLVEEAIYQVRRNLPKRFYGQLPTMKTALGTSVPRVLALAWLYVAHTDSTVMPQSLRAMVQGYQSAEPLRIGELWALPTLLRFVLTENLRRIALRVKRSRELRQMANDVADRVLAMDDGNARERMLAAYTRHARDSTFATQLLYRLRDGSQNSGKALGWLESELEKHGTDAEELIITEHQTLSSGNVTTGNIIRSLRMINDTDWTSWFESVSQVDTLLRENTNFADLDIQSRDQYRTAIEDLARRSGKAEYTVAKHAVELVAAQAAPVPPGEETANGTGVDIGFFLTGSRREELEKAIGYRPSFGRRTLRLYRKTGWLGLAVPVVALTAIFLWLAGIALSNAGLSNFSLSLLLVLLAFPAADGAVGLFNTIALLFLKPALLVGFDFKDGLPASAKTLVVIPALIGSREDVEEITHNLEVHYLANIHGEIYFALLSDWADSQMEQSDADLEILTYARKKIAELNERHRKDGVVRFHLLHRRRLFNEGEHCWMGWERKRGKLHELNLLLRGDADTTFLTPDSPLPDDVVYVMTLDADTRTTRDVVKRLAGKLCHPLNSPVFDSARRLVVSGYGILQPRVTASLTTGDEASFFQRVFSANRGMDPYVFAVSDVYQDIYGEGTFTGKGLYHIDAMEAAVAGRIRENSVLSHDLLEGALARAALVTDVELVEDYPTRYSVDASRHHRWARGDWQLLPLIFSSACGVPPVSRWKMVDNLRRTLTPIFWVASSVAAWTFLPFAFAAQWQLFLILILFVAPTFDIVAGILPDRANVTLRGHFNAFGHDVAFGTAQVALRMVLIAHLAWLMGDAIVRTLYRLFYSHEHLLEWRTALQAERQGDDLASYYRTMIGAIVIAVISFAVPFLAGSSGMFVALIFAVFWVVSPAFAWLVSRSAETEDRLVVSPEDTEKLRSVARRTWLFFETFVTASDHMLPPDNYQETPHPVVAHRTSPTNIGIYLLSAISARDFGWVGMAEVLDRIEATLDTVEKLEMFRGHLYNWYDTQTLQPLQPRYISAVDSGNLAGHLVAVSAACQEWALAPAAYMEGDFDGLLDVVKILEETLDALPDDRRQLRPLRQRLRDRISGTRRAIETIKREPEMAAVRTINLAVMAAEIRKLAAAMNQETESAASGDLSLWADKLAETCNAHVDDAHTDEALIEKFRTRLKTVGTRCRTLAFGMDFSFLLRQDRKLLSIGYRAADHQLDESCYDLLASEARLASLFAIAKGDIPTDHWFHLGRPIVEIGFRGALMSWSGSMFEYLMPPLVMKEPQGGILNQTNHLIIKRQMQYGHEKRIPWGISEAAYNARDREMTYQYTNFGVPGLGLKRGLALNTVIAPYATILASQYMPREAVQNLQRLNALGALGRYGYHDAIDFTPQRVPEGTDHAVVYNYMAHHSGMSVVAIANVIFEGRMRDRFHSDPVIELAELLLQEKAPRNIPAATLKTEAAERAKGDVVPVEAPDTRLVLNPLEALPTTNLVSNGHYSVMVTAAGSGYSRFRDLAVTRWQADSTEDRMGTYLFLRDVESGDWWSATAEPKRAPSETSYTLMSDDKTSFLKSVGTLRSEVECIVVSEGNGEGRRITISNDGPSERIIEVTSYAEVVLAPEAADSAHPAFSKMFVETEIAPHNGTIFATRRKRERNEGDIALAHFVTDNSGVQREGEAETDRRNFIGRGRAISDAAAFDPGARLSGGQGFVLDPIVALRRRVRVAPNKKVTLTFWTVVGANREEVEATIDRIDHPDSFARQAMLSWTRSQVQTRHVGLSLAAAANVQKLARYLIYPDKWMRRPAEAIASGLSAQSALWPLSISGDFPIFAVRIGDQADLEIIANALRMQEYLRARGLLIDLVIINEQASSYVQDLQQAIEALCENSRLRGREHGPREHIFAVRRDLIEKKSYRTLMTVARVVVHTRNGTIFDQIERAEAIEMQARGIAVEGELTPPRAVPAAIEPIDAHPALSAPASGDDLNFWNGFGGFADEDGEYVVRLGGNSVTPHPWINVVANGGFGFHTSAEGASFTWSRNSRDFQLTPWSNDPVTNRPGEAIYIFDQASGKAFSPFAAVARDGSMTYEARHGKGESTFRAIRGKLAIEVTQIVDPNDPVKISRMVIRNGGFVPAKLRVYAYAEWVLGTNRSKSAPTIVPVLDADAGILMARNPYSTDYGDGVAFLASDVRPDSLTADRAEFIGRKGSSVLPEAVAAGAALSGTVEAGRDPCAALARDVEIAAGEEATLLFLIGDAGSPQEAADLTMRHAARDFDERLAEIRNSWNGFLDTVQIETPDKAMDLMVNHWLPYQALACRIRARTAFYQASGAFGFRDQLQDTLAMLTHDPSLAAAQIENAASRQFVEGDFQHWWLPRNGAGVRTTISDDAVWLAYGAAHYVKVTGDRSILAKEVHFITGEPLKEGEHDSFFTPGISEEKATIYEHAARGLDLAIKRTGSTGLPLILGGRLERRHEPRRRRRQGRERLARLVPAEDAGRLLAPGARTQGRQARGAMERACQASFRGPGYDRLGWRMVPTGFL